MNRLSRPSWAKLPAFRLPSWARHRGNSQRPYSAVEREGDALDLFIKWSTLLAVLAAAAIGGWVSYVHALDVVSAHGETGILAHLYPGTIDGLVYSASMVLLDSARRGVASPLLAKVLLALGIGATVACNVLSGLSGGWLSAIVGAWPAIALVGSYETLMMLVRRSSRPVSVPVAHGSLAGVLGWPPVAVTVPVSENTGTVAPTPAPGPASLTVAPGPARKRVRSSGRKSAETHLTRAERTFKDHIGSGTLPSLREVMSTAKVGQPRAREIRTHLDALISERAA